MGVSRSVRQNIGPVVMKGQLSTYFGNGLHGLASLRRQSVHPRQESIDSPAFR